MLPEAHPLARAVGLAVFLAAVPGGARAGEQPSYAGRDPEEEGKTFRLAPGFRIELAAREPEVADPVSVAWDAKGRMWVAEMPDYPQGTAGGRVRLLEDADRDGRYEKSTVFAEGLPF